MNGDEKTIVVRLLIGDRDISNLRLLLKTLLRRYKLRCVEIRAEQDAP